MVGFLQVDGMALSAPPVGGGHAFGAGRAWASTTTFWLLLAFTNRQNVVVDGLPGGARVTGTPVG